MLSTDSAGDGVSDDITGLPGGGPKKLPRILGLKARHILSRSLSQSSLVPRGSRRVAGNSGRHLCIGADKT